MQILKPYPSYKDSGVEWLGEVPEHWGIRPVFSAFVPNQERNNGMKEETVLSLSYGRIIIKPQEKLHGLVPESFETYQIVNPCDIVLRTTDLQNDRTSLRVGLVRDRGIISSAYLALRVDTTLIPAFGFQFLSVWDTSKAIYGYGSGLRQSLNFSHFKRMPVAVPPLSEQTAIVRFLGYMDRRIQRLIRAKQKLIKLLEEQKQAIIHEAVTGRIDVRTGKPYPAYKDSGVEWLGEVPEHWKVPRVKSLSLVKRGASPRPIADQKYFDDEGEYAWVRILDVSASGKYLEKTTQRLSSLGDSLSVRLEPGALFLSIAGSIGKPIITKIKCCIHDGFVYFPRLRGNVEFLFRVFSSGAPFGRLGKLGTQLNLNTDSVGGIRLGWPSPSEQAAIVTYLNNATYSSERAITSTYIEIALLREYRTRLISDVVTGKVDVRVAAALLPDEPDDEPAEEPDAEDETPDLDELESAEEEGEE